MFGRRGRTAMRRRKRPAEPEVPAPPAYTEGFLQQDYDYVASSLREDPGQALLNFGNLRTTLLHAACYDGRADLAEQLIRLGEPKEPKEPKKEPKKTLYATAPWA